MLRWGNHENRNAFAKIRQIVGCAYRSMQRHARQEHRISMGCVDRLDNLCLIGPQAYRRAITGHHLRQSRTPGTPAKDANFGLSSHALTPAPRTVSASGSSGQRGRAGTSSESVRPAAKRSAPAQPIIAALSVHSHIGGATKGM